MTLGRRQTPRRLYLAGVVPNLNSPFAPSSFSSQSSARHLYLAVPVQVTKLSLCPDDARNNKQHPFFFQEDDSDFDDDDDDITDDGTPCASPQPSNAQPLSAPQSPAQPNPPEVRPDQTRLNARWPQCQCQCQWRWQWRWLAGPSCLSFLPGDCLSWRLTLLTPVARPYCCSTPLLL